MPRPSRLPRLGVPERLAPVVAWRWAPHLALFVLALVLRVAWVLWVDRSGFVLNDAIMYHGTAENLALGRGYKPPLSPGPSAQWPPGYSTVLAALYWLFGVEPLWGELFNAVVGAVTVVLFVLLVERALDRRTAVVAGVALAVMPGPILWTDVLVTETLFTALFVLLFLVLVHARPTPVWLVAIGLVIGIGGLVRGEALTWSLLPIVRFWPELPRVELVKRIAAIAAVVVATLVPWTIRNAVVMDAFVPLATNASITLWAGHNPTATGGQVYPDSSYYAEFDPDPPHWELQSSASLRNDAIEFMLTNPVRELELIPLKLIHLQRGDSYAFDWVNAAPDGPPIEAIDVERIGVLADAAYYALLALTVIGVLVLGRGFWRATTIGRLITTSFLTALVLYGFLYYGNYRYRLPYEPLMIVVAATVVTRLWSHRPLTAPEPSA